MKKSEKIIYRVLTALFSAMIMLGVGNYFFNHEVVAQAMTNLGFPTYIIYPLGIAKTLGIAAIWFSKSKTLKEWAYAGFTFNLLLAVSAHLTAADGEFAGAAIALLLNLGSYFYYKKSEKAVAADKPSA